ncbi:uncharacterized protein THITE_2118616 [Thermothielavioides terrestris NRRL 8126]|uniref:Uncharacterized protein n=1 Tax=Thermothielavioides terrestris (strain ATCC 38088 / NRRL 8126) TaxID=578455 RepID=G2RAD2_THETT|nr:uncharacterized protein THITE_2118616 [Thermothielavioides terrestris NRRL 8126]AEO68864.1 hypothetical protein THITE_2118616 [Thermothielavioides terrestris NRRL 8126]
MPYTGDGRSNGRTPESQRGGGGLIGWLSGSAGAANSLGLHAANGAPKVGTTPDTTPTRALRSATGAGSTASDAVTPRSTMTTASRFMSAISSRFNPSTPTSPALADDYANDEFYNLNIEAALFPRGSPPSDRDPFSPSAFKNLHMNAIGLLTRMQAAYREQAAALRDLRAERSARKDELEEAETRARHLKMQLEDMARKAQEHQRVVQSLMEELAAERRAREDERRAAVAASSPNGAVAAAAVPPSEGASMVSEDLGVDEDRRRRRRGTGRRRSHRNSWKSGVSCEEDGDDDSEDDEDENESAESESLFSRCRSPPLPVPLTPAQTTASEGSVAGVMSGAGTPHARNPGGASAHVTPKQKPVQPMSAFQKILKGISGEPAEGAGAKNGCPNCQGQDASVAWDTVSLLRDENRHLKKRVGELEGAVEGALDLVNGIGL